MQLWWFLTSFHKHHSSRKLFWLRFPAWRCLTCCPSLILVSRFYSWEIIIIIILPCFAQDETMKFKLFWELAEYLLALKMKMDMRRDMVNSAESSLQPSLTPFRLSCSVCTSKCDLLWSFLFFSTVLGPRYLPSVSALLSAKARLNPKGSTAVSANKPSPCYEGPGSNRDPPASVFQREGALTLHCSEALLNLLQSERGRRAKHSWCRTWSV